MVSNASPEEVVPIFSPSFRASLPGLDLLTASLVWMGYANVNDGWDMVIH